MHCIALEFFRLRFKKEESFSCSPWFFSGVEIRCHVERYIDAATNMNLFKNIILCGAARERFPTDAPCAMMGCRALESSG